jgi:pimeloyl-ACP methyl ester carboxylesterase
MEPPAWVINPARFELNVAAGEAWHPTLQTLVALETLLTPTCAAGYAELMNGTLAATAANGLRITDKGLRYDGPSTNLLSTSFAPATQTISGLPGNGATYYALCVWGDGSAVVSGSASAQTARQGQPLIFAPASTGNLTVTVSGTLTAFSLTNITSGAGGPAMPATGARAGDSVQFAGDLLAAVQGAAFTLIVETDAMFSTENQTIVSGPGSTDIALASTANFDRVYSSNGSTSITTAYFPSGASASGTSSFITRWAIAANNSGWSVSGQGGTAVDATGTPPNVSQIGGNPGAYGNFYGYFRWMAVETVKESDANLALLTSYPVTIETFSYSSSIDAASYPALTATVAYNPNLSGQPLLILMHGMATTSAAFDTACYQRFVTRGYFVVAPDLRATISGSRRDIFDITDAVTAARQFYAQYLDSAGRNYMVGYSAGGGNTLNCAMKCPDLFCAYVDHFGMSDYGTDPTYGWYYTNTIWDGDLQSIFGGTPTAVPNAYQASDAYQGVPTNLLGGELLMFADAGDANVAVSHSTRMQAAMVAAGNLLSTLWESNNSAGDVYWWEHGYPIETPSGPYPNCHSEDIWMRWLARPNVRAPWRYPISGSCRVHGFLKTKRFEIDLGNLDDQVATLSWNCAANSYTVTPLTGSMSVTVKVGTLSQTQTISSATTFSPT